jgi:hypothetical protein
VQPNLLWKINNYYVLWVSICSLKCTAWNAHAPYRHQWSAYLLPYFSTLSLQRHDLRKDLLNKIYLFRFSLQILSETFVILTKIKRDSITNMLSIHVNYPLFLLDLNKTLILLTYFRKISYVKFHENPSRGIQVVPSVRTDRDEVNIRFSRFCESALKPLWIIPEAHVYVGCR